MQKILAVAILVAFVSPVLAEEFYVVQDVKTKKCSVVNENPKGTTAVTQIGRVAFKTRQEGERGLKTRMCTEQ